MRTIAFRAWQKTTKTMFHHIEKGTGAPDGNPPFADYLENPNMIVMQFTGLTDRHGKEMYEGDILLVRFGKHTVEVRWNVTGFGFFNLGTQQWQLLYAGDLKQVEVIGNIYENSELLVQP